MKKRVLLALTMAMATAAMFVSPAIADTVGLPTIVASATSNNTTPATSGGAAAVAAPAPAVVTSSGVTLESTVATESVGAYAAVVTTPSATLRASAGLNDGETARFLVESHVGPDAYAVLNSAALSLGSSQFYPLDITLYADGRNVEDNRVTQLAAPVRFVLAAPYDGTVYDMAVVRVHNGAITVLPDLDTDPATVTFDTDRFSAYAIVPVAKGSLNNVKDNVPKTGDGLPTAIPATATVGLAALAMTAVALNKKKRA